MNACVAYPTYLASHSNSPFTRLTKALIKHTGRGWGSNQHASGDQRQSPVSCTGDLHLLMGFTSDWPQQGLRVHHSSSPVEKRGRGETDRRRKTGAQCVPVIRFSAEEIVVIHSSVSEAPTFCSDAVPHILFQANPFLVTSYSYSNWSLGNIRIANRWLHIQETVLLFCIVTTLKHRILCWQKT